jgi:hypothetical protein
MIVGDPDATCVGDLNERIIAKPHFQCIAVLETRFGLLLPFGDRE